MPRILFQTTETQDRHIAGVPVHLSLGPIGFPFFFRNAVNTACGHNIVAS